MKKIIAIVLCIALLVAVASVFAGCENVPREEQLKIYLPGEYMDYEIFADFEAFYQEKTGKRVKVIAEEFDAVENIQLSVEGGKADYDLLCPSDYMVEYLIKKDLLIAVDKSIVDVEEEGLFRPEYIETTKEFDPELKYAVPYMYGTLGLVYDYSKTQKHIDSWESYFGNEFAGNGTRSIKKSVRDAYAVASIYNAREETAGLTGDELKAKIQSIFEDASDEAVAAASTTLGKVISGNAVWDVDQIKFDMAAGRGNVKVALMWSCDAGYVMNDYEDDDGNEQQGNRNLWYVVPKEGGNVYIDAFVISKYAKNVDAAQWFLAYLCQKDVAIANSEYAGCISPVKEAYDELYEAYTTDEEMFEGTAEGWKEMFIETMFPSVETLNRCGVMKDLGDGKTAVNKMWANLQ